MKLVFFKVYLFLSSQYGLLTTIYIKLPENHQELQDNSDVGRVHYPSFENFCSESIFGVHWYRADSIYCYNSNEFQELLCRRVKGNL